MKVKDFISEHTGVSISVVGGLVVLIWTIAWGKIEKVESKQEQYQADISVIKSELAVIKHILKNKQ